MQHSHISQVIITQHTTLSPKELTLALYDQISKTQTNNYYNNYYRNYFRILFNILLILTINGKLI